MESKRIEDALSAGAAAVVAKSTNESDDAKKQLNRADYAKIGHDFTKYQWEEKTVDQPSLFCRSGLTEMDAKEWLDVVATMDGLAKKKQRLCCCKSHSQEERFTSRISRHRPTTRY